MSQKQKTAATPFAATIDCLARTDNAAASAVLLAALDSPHLEVQDGALDAIMVRRSLVCQREIIRRFDTVSERWLDILNERRGRMTQALRDALLSHDEHLCRNACAAILRFSEFDLMSTLVNAAEDEANPLADLAATTLLSLADLLYAELHNPRDYKLRRDPQMVRRNIAVSLEESVKRFPKHQRREPLEAFLLLAGRENSALMQILCDPRHPSYLAVIQTLQTTERLGIMRLILSYLDDPQSPTSLVSVIAHRADQRFIELLLRKIGREPTAGARTNLRHVTSIAWLKEGPQLLDQLDDAGQHSALQLVLATGMKNADQFAIVQYLAMYGNAGGRRAAAESLTGFTGVEANQLIQRCLQDPDPLVKAAALNLLRPRSISGALATLIKFLDDEHPAVRKAAQQNLPEYAFARFVASFETLDEAIRDTTAKLVLKADPQAIASLRQEMRSNSGKRRLRALAIARTMKVCDTVEDALLLSLEDPDHLVRVEAAISLGECHSAKAQ
ncbi:MAG: HEAT repeat domain-containing protein, partial [Planctomycetaceae bacterium]|nr:HEAT repeat domain-containing protein [Planctomycetaceae bacterium]